MIGDDIMKKNIKKIVSKRSKLIMEYIGQILLDNEVVTGNIDIGSVEINNKMMCVIDIYVPNRNFERHFNSDIESINSSILEMKILDDLIDNFLKYTIIELGYFSRDENYNRITIKNKVGSSINLNFLNNTDLILEQINKYNEKIGKNYENK